MLYLHSKLHTFQNYIHCSKFTSIHNLLQHRDSATYIEDIILDCTYCFIGTKIKLLFKLYFVAM